ncbi:MAG: hypothetical protein EA412_12670 [Chitinophagaceae bacterium]|nr:MAG: hypothetical protein EA412_12670 [Chitinophagaceae bacterium]
MVKKTWLKSAIQLIFVSVIVLTTISSCKVFYPNEMWRTGDEIEPALPADTVKSSYTFQSGDIFSMSVYTRKGQQLIEIFGGTGATTPTRQNISYTVRPDGKVDLPSIGTFEIKGLTKLEAKKELEEAYSQYLNDPFVLLQIENHRTFVYFGRGDATVINLPRDETNIVEVIALAGGMPSGVKAHRIRVMREIDGEMNIKLIDLSTVENWLAADLIIKPNDIIYIEPVRRVGPAFATILGEITPILSLATTLLTIYLLVTN